MVWTKFTQFTRNALKILEVLMRSKKILWAAAVVVLTASLASCNIGKSAAPTQDVSSIFTQAAGTMIAQFNDQQTQTALAAPTGTDTPTAGATFTALPTFPVAGITPFGVGGTAFVFNTPVGGTPIATTGGGPVYSTANGCNDAAFVLDVTAPDKTILARGRIFDKIWEISNTGTCSWGTGYQFAYQAGDRMTGANIVITKSDTATAPGHTNSFVVWMKAPLTPGEYIGYWKMQTNSGVVFGQRFSVDIIVP
jgi:Ig-like domain from next to BRCA1 gene